MTDLFWTFYEVQVSSPWKDCIPDFEKFHLFQSHLTATKQIKIGFILLGHDILFVFKPSFTLDSYACSTFRTLIRPDTFILRPPPPPSTIDLGLAALKSPEIFSSFIKWSRIKQKKVFTVDYDRSRSNEVNDAKTERLQTF